jgi:hypothetical protein
MPDMMPISRIILDRELQPRIAEMRQVILDYARALNEGAQFPPVVVFDVAEKGLILADGFHRLEAHKHLKRREIPAEIRVGTWLQAFRFAREFNMKHGCRLNRIEVQRAIRDYLQNEELAWMSDREIARHLGVDNKTVAAQRRALDLGQQENLPVKPSVRGRPLPPDRSEQTRAFTLIGNCRAALDALTEAEGVDRVQVEIANWYGAVTGGTVKWIPPKR